MAETATSSSPLKRIREDQETQEETKRQKLSSDSQNLCLLDDENDLTSLIITLQEDISVEDQNVTVLEFPALSTSSSCSSSSSSSSPKEEEYESDVEKVMKHLLEASDDELGIPNTDFGGSSYEIKEDYVNDFSLLDGFGDVIWEFEDEAANYYTLLQSELFM